MRLSISKTTLERIERIAKISRRDPSQVVESALALWEEAILTLLRRKSAQRILMRLWVINPTARLRRLKLPKQSPDGNRPILMSNTRITPVTMR
jgi:hypothetical protein